MKKPRPRKPKGLTAIEVSGFKSIATPQTLHIRPLTVLAGANSSGKSSIMQPLLLTKQTMEAFYDPGVFHLDGPNVKFSSAEQVLYFKTRKRSDSFTVSYTISELKISLKYKKNRKSNFDIVYMELSGKSKESRRFVAGDALEEVVKYLEFFFDSDFGIKDGVDSFQDMKLISSRSCLRINVGDSFFLSLLLGDFYPLGEFDKIFFEMIHLPGLRGNPERNYDKVNVRHVYPKLFQGYTASIISQWQEANDPRLQELGRQLGELGLTKQVCTIEVNPTKVEIQVAKLLDHGKGKASFVNIADVGLGVSQTLPVLVSLLSAQEGQIVYIEQPEIHLHPRAQWHLAEMLVQAAKRNVKVIIETHSDILLLGIQTLVAKGEFEASRVGLHWFTRDPHDGGTTVTFTELDPMGRQRDWPQDFSETYFNAEKEFLDAVEAREWQKKNQKPQQS